MDMIATATKFLKEAQGRDVDINKVIEANNTVYYRNCSSCSDNLQWNNQTHFLIHEIFTLFLLFIHILFIIEIHYTHDSKFQ